MDTNSRYIREVKDVSTFFLRSPAKYVASFVDGQTLCELEAPESCTSTQNIVATQRRELTTVHASEAKTN
jgi:hypothetical protein